MRSKPQQIGSGLTRRRRPADTARHVHEPVTKDSTIPLFGSVREIRVTAEWRGGNAELVVHEERPENFQTGGEVKAAVAAQGPLDEQNQLERAKQRDPQLILKNSASNSLFGAAKRRQRHTIRAEGIAELGETSRR
ncbi:MAG: hypothetical protein M1823_001643 [Watsoniomyces obsoletus]|nr:MAG: hypothetical protein M1823_001643 [Watsoniomyces obsoletus]